MQTQPQAPVADSKPPVRARRMLSVAQLAKLLGTSEATIWRWSREGTMPAALKLGKKLTRWDSTAIEAWLASKAAA